MDKIILERMEFYGYHGAFAEENKLGQRFYVDVVAHVDIRPAAASDDLNQTINYVDIFERIRQIVEGQPYKLLETLTERIASVLLDDYTTINEVEVKVTKPHPPANIHFAGVAIQVHRKRVKS